MIKRKDHIRPTSIIIFFFLLGSTFVHCQSVLHKVSNYRVYFAQLDQENHLPLYALRRFGLDSSEVFLAFNPENLRTIIVPEDSVHIDSIGLSRFQSVLRATAFGNCLDYEVSNNHNLQDAGLKSLSPAVPGIFLTVDLCPSQKPLNRELFTRIIETFHTEEGPVPVSIAITGTWIKGHPEDLDWLKILVRDSLLRITWVNHSLHHHYKPDLPLEENFMLEKNTNMAKEILGNEKLMLENGILPSVFFRFPGLVSDTSIFNQVLHYGLLPLGSDAWLAKGQKARQGSIVLVHGNNNEPLGIRKFLQLLDKNQDLIREKKWLLLDLDERAGKVQ